MSVKGMVGIANLLNSLWILYLVYLYPTFCTGCFDSVPVHYDLIVSMMLVVGLILVIDSGACLAGKWLGLPMGALLSSVTIPLLIMKLYYFGAFFVGLGVVFAVAAVVLDVVAAVSKTAMPEQNHPLNLPVFG